MLTKKETQPVRDLLRNAAGYFKEDEKRLGSQKLWDATVAALALIAEERGWAGETEDDHWDIIDRLTAGYYDPDEAWLDAGYLVALSMQEYAAGGFAEDYEFIVGVPGGIWFVEELLKIAERPV